jgi:hypothetical protein
VRLEELGKPKKTNDLMETRTRNLPSCSIVPVPAALQVLYFLRSSGSGTGSTQPREYN